MNKLNFQFLYDGDDALSTESDNIFYLIEGYGNKGFLLSLRSILDANLTKLISEETFDNIYDALDAANDYEFHRERISAKVKPEENFKNYVREIQEQLVCWRKV